MTFFLPWKCEDERHGYEACQYAEYVLCCFALLCFAPKHRPKASMALLVGATRGLAWLILSCVPKTPQKQVPEAGQHDGGEELNCARGRARIIN